MDGRCLAERPWRSRALAAARSEGLASSRSENRPLERLLVWKSIGPAAVTLQGAADVDVRVRADVLAAGVVHVETGVGAGLLRRRQPAGRGGEDDRKSDRGLGEHGR